MTQPNKTGKGRRPADEEPRSSRSIIIRLNTATHIALKTQVAREDTTIQAWATELIQNRLRVSDPVDVEGDSMHTRQIIVRMDVETHIALRTRVAREDTTIQSWVLGLIKQKLGLV